MPKNKMPNKRESTMNICHVNLATGFSGGERQTLVLIKEQIKLGYTLTVVANPKSPFFHEVEKLNCRVFAAKHFLLGHSSKITRDCAVMHVHEGRAIYWAYIQKLLFKTPYIITRRIDNPLKNKPLSLRAYDSASAITGVSNKVVEVVKQRHPDAHAVFIPDSPARYTSDPIEVQKIREQFEGKFSFQAKITTLLTGLSGYYMLEVMNAWDRYLHLQFWWMHLMTFVWAIFTLVLFVLEPLVLHKWFHKQAETDSDKSFFMLHLMHKVRSSFVVFLLKDNLFHHFHQQQFL